MAPVELLWIIVLPATALAAVGLHHELRRRAVTRAVAGEVAGLRWQAMALAVEITRRHRAGEPFDGDFFQLWRLSQPQIAPGLGADFGLLRGGALDRVGYFYTQLADARERLAIASVHGEFGPSAYRILSALVRASNHVQPWIEPVLDPSIWEPPCLKDANALLGEFEVRPTEPIAMAYIWADACRNDDGSDA